jgi:NAD(P)-dependent dehydrogenase (short-subunit alcohol dehydrogenase family)
MGEGVSRVGLHGTIDPQRLLGGFLHLGEGERILQGKLCLVTGANSGIGLITARELVRRGADVLLACRRPEQGHAACAQIARETGRAPLDLLVADFASLAEVRGLAERVRALGRPLDVLVNNAGLMLTERVLTRDGFETMFGVNHLAPFLLTRLLRDRLPPDGRVVTVASRAHKRAILDFDDLQGERSFGGWEAYCRSKLCNVLFSAELARRLGSPGPTSNSLHPGVVATGFGREGNALWRGALRLARPLMTSPEEGAATTLYLAASPDVQGVTGHYFVRCRAAEPSRAGSDARVAARLWELSERLVGLAAEPAASQG